MPERIRILKKSISGGCSRLRVVVGTRLQTQSIGIDKAGVGQKDSNDCTAAFVGGNGDSAAVAFDN